MSNFHTLALAIARLSLTAGEAYSQVEPEIARNYLHDVMTTTLIWNARLIETTGGAPLASQSVPPGATESVLKTIDHIGGLAEEPLDMLEKSLERIDFDLQHLYQVLSTLPAGAPAPLPPPPRPRPKRSTRAAG